MIHEYKNVRSVIQWSGFCAKVLFIFKENKTVKDFQIMPHRKSFWPPLRIIMPLLGTFCPNRGKKLEKWVKSANISDNELTSICFKLTTKCALNRPFCLNNKWIAVEVLQSSCSFYKSFESLRSGFRMLELYLPLEKIGVWWKFLASISFSQVSPANCLWWKSRKYFAFLKFKKKKGWKHL